MWLWMKRVTLAVLIALAMSQVFRPARTNPTIDPRQDVHSNLRVDPHMAATLARACNDCHSNRTVWPWYSRVAPASWLVVSDVNRGRKALNFSEWSSYGTPQQREHLQEICKEISDGEMPSFPYTLMHRDARLSKTDVAAVCSWTHTYTQTPVAEQD